MIQRDHAKMIHPCLNQENVFIVTFQDNSPTPFSG